jgi:hypothetical protein
MPTSHAGSQPRPTTAGVQPAAEADRADASQSSALETIGRSRHSDRRDPGKTGLNALTALSLEPIACEHAFYSRPLVRWWKTAEEAQSPTASSSAHQCEHPWENRSFLLKPSKEGHAFTVAALLSMLSRMFDQQWSRHMDHQAGRCGDSESAIQI